jgi:hypothetical protein
MTGEDQIILDAPRHGRFRFAIHAVRRMKQRSVTKADILACGRTAGSCDYQPERGTYRVEGEDLDGELLIVICGLEDGVVVVTVF